MVLTVIGLILLVALVSRWMENNTYIIVGAIVAIAAIIGIVTYLKHRREVPKFDDHPIVPIDPPWEELSGTFTCAACGGKTTFCNEVNPSTACKFCGSEIPDIRIMILERNQRRQDLITEDLKRQQEDRQERLNIHLRNLNEYRVQRNDHLVEGVKNSFIGIGRFLIGGIAQIIGGLIALIVVLFLFLKYFGFF